MNLTEVELLKAALKKLLSQCNQTPAPDWVTKDIIRVINDINQLERTGFFDSPGPNISTEQL